MIERSLFFQKFPHTDGVTCLINTQQTSSKRNIGSTHTGHDGQQTIHKHKEFNKHTTYIQNKYTSIAASMIKTKPNKLKLFVQAMSS